VRRSHAADGTNAFAAKYFSFGCDDWPRCHATSIITPAATTMAIDALTSAEAEARKSVKEVFDYVVAQGDSDYLGERVSQLQHSLQAATLAQKAGADEDTVLGALLHDVGRFIPAADKMSSMTGPDGTYIGKASHEVVGERYLRQLGFSEKICQLVGAHVMAKRYLTAVDRGYYDGLSKSSKMTLKYQVFARSS
jgi:2-amino-1-hydroxyethylphosphonate dioxygenase (glycine-forming)